MAINIGTKTPTAHDQAASQIEEETTITTTNTGQNSGAEDQPEEKHTFEATPVSVPKLHEVLEVGMAFKMPVAQYTMLEFSIRRSMPYDPKETSPDEAFEENRQWVEGKLNDLIAEQQNEG